MNTAGPLPSKRFISFAGVPGSGKTPVSFYVSWNTGLPIISNDATRFEVREDLGRFDDTEYLRRRDERVDAVLASGRSFIYDASVDRSWKEMVPRLERHGYTYHVISFDLDEQFVANLYRAKEYADPADDHFFAEHAAFLKNYGGVVATSITPANYRDRLALALAGATSFLAS